jgi:hypothetical protein
MWSGATFLLLCFFWRVDNQTWDLKSDWESSAYFECTVHAPEDQKACGWHAGCDFFHNVFFLSPSLIPFNCLYSATWSQGYARALVHDLWSEQACGTSMMSLHNRNTFWNVYILKIWVCYTYVYVWVFCTAFLPYGEDFWGCRVFMHHCHLQ